MLNYISNKQFSRASTRWRVSEVQPAIVYLSRWLTSLTKDKCRWCHGEICPRCAAVPAESIWSLATEGLYERVLETRTCRSSCGTILNLCPVRPNGSSPHACSVWWTLKSSLPLESWAILELEQGGRGMLTQWQMRWLFFLKNTVTPVWNGSVFVWCSCNDITFGFSCESTWTPPKLSMHGEQLSLEPQVNLRNQKRQHSKLPITLLHHISCLLRHMTVTATMFLICPGSQGTKVALGLAVGAGRFPYVRTR